MDLRGQTESMSSRGDGADRYIGSRMLVRVSASRFVMNLGGPAELIRPKRPSFGAVIFLEVL